MAPAADGGEPALVRTAAIRTPYRVVYPHSVIRGGAYTVEELDAALRADPVAAAHYAVFDRTQTRITQARDSAAVYVSYRQGDRVYWTRRKVRLKAEEALFTDGVHTARARCGNRISLTAQQPVRAGEPDIDMDVPESPQVPYAIPGPFQPPGDFSLPLLVHEAFPSLLGNWLPGGIPVVVTGGTGWSPVGVGGAGGPGGWPLPGPGYVATPPGYTPPGYTPPATVALPPATLVNGSIGSTPLALALPPVVPGLPWSAPVLLPGYAAGATLGPQALGMAAPPTGIPSSGIPGIPEVPPSRGTTSGFSFPPIPGSGSPPQVQPPPDSPSAPNAGVPEPATLALLLCGGALLACRRVSGRPSAA